MAKKSGFRGSITALVTPFKAGKLDEQAFRSLIDWQIAEGTSGFVPVGTTGESPTLSHAEHHRVVEICISESKGRVPVIAGAGSNNTDEAVDLAVHAEKAGADAVRARRMQSGHRQPPRFLSIECRLAASILASAVRAVAALRLPRARAALAACVSNCGQCASLLATATATATKSHQSRSTMARAT